MEPERWKRMESLWEHALALSPEQLRTFLDGLREEDFALSRDLEALLASDRDSSFLVRPLFAGEGADPWLGRQLGSYRLLERIGEGGMSMVYLARQEGDEFERNVAVKLLRGLHLPDLGRRLVAERQILASLEHPNIARFLDGGSTEEGVPYVVMEYVDGLPITEHCRSSGRDLGTVLRLFCRACEAVQYAHSHLVVHRDLKPANLLVSAGGEPKLLDFGLAKLLDASGLSAGDPTETQYRALTPNYASPEQIAGRTVTTATDVYSLGVLLYELVAGVRPFEHAGRSPAEIQQALETTQPPRPSERLAGSEGHGGPGRWRVVPADLDRIVLKALAAEPERRYSSVQALSDDLQRFLDGLPVHAQTLTWSYRARKFVGRNRTAVTLGASLGVSVLAFALTASLQALRLHEERDIARREQARAEEAVAFVERIFQIQDPHNESASRAGMEELLDSQRHRVLEDLAGQPELQVRLASTLGLIYQNQGFLPKAQELLERSVALAHQTYGPEHVQTARARRALGSLLTSTGDFVAAEDNLAAAIAILERQLPDTRSDLAEALTALGQMHRLMGDNDGAEAPLRRAVELSEPEEDATLARRLSYLAIVRQRQGDLAEAESLARRAVTLTEAPGVSELALADTSNVLGELLRNKARYREAEQHLRRALEIYRRRLNDDALTGAVLVNLGVVLRSRGDYRGALAAYQEGLEIMRRIHGEESLFVAVGLTNLSRLERILGDLGAADRHLSASLSIYRRLVGEGPSEVGLVLKAYAELRRDQGRPAEALELVHKAQDLLARHVAADHPWRTTTRITEGSILIDLGRFAEAEERLGQGLAGLEQELGAGAPPVAEAKAQLARLRLRQGRLEASATLFLEAEELWQAVDVEHPERGLCLAQLAEVYRRQGRLSEAREVLGVALPILRGALLPQHSGLQQASLTELALGATS